MLQITTVLLLLLFVGLPGMLFLGITLGKSSRAESQQGEMIQTTRTGILSRCPTFHSREQPEVMVRVLTQIQVIFGTNNTTDPTLWDVVRIILSLQLAYGWHCSLENVIQRLCAIVQRRQIEARKGRFKHERAKGTRSLLQEVSSVEPSLAFSSTTST